MTAFHCGHSSQEVTPLGGALSVKSMRGMEALAENLRRLRRSAGLTQAALAAKAGLPRATLAAMEHVRANPGIQAVVAVARALAVGLDELACPAPGSQVVKVAPRQTEDFRADAGRFSARMVSPISSKGVQIHHLRLQPGCNSVGRPHPRGAQEFFLSLQGQAIIQVGDEVFPVSAGELLLFPGHLRHVYANPGHEPVQAVSVVVMHLD